MSKIGRAALWAWRLQTLAKVKSVTTLIAVVAATVSFVTQRALLEYWSVDRFSQWAVPFTVDLLAIVCFVAAHQRLTWVGYLITFTAMGIALAVSFGANWYAAGHTWAAVGADLGAKLAHCWTVVAYLLAELVTLAVALKRDPAPEKNPNRVEGGKRAAAKRLAKAKPAGAPRTSRTRVPRAPRDSAEAAAQLAAAGVAPISPAV